VEHRGFDLLVQRVNELYEQVFDNPEVANALGDLSTVIDETGVPIDDAAGEFFSGQTFLELPSEAIDGAERILIDTDLYEEWLAWEAGLLREAGVNAGWAERVQGVLREEQGTLLQIVEQQRNQQAQLAVPGGLVAAFRNWIGEKLGAAKDKLGDGRDKVGATAGAAGAAIVRVLKDLKDNRSTQKQALVILTGGVVGIVDAAAGASIAAGATVVPPALAGVAPGAIWLSQIAGGALMTNDKVRDKVAGSLPG
jgi:hypothetical protein